MKKKKIGIITTTFQNYGSKLQNLATVELLKHLYPSAKIETIVISRHTNFIFNIVNYMPFLRFLYAKIRYQGKINRNNKFLHYRIYFIKKYDVKSLEFLNNKYDLFYVGSDQIWNSLEEDANFNFAMFTKNKICNSPSFVVRSGIDKNKLKTFLMSFSSLNVREQATADYIKREMCIECEVLKDPTLRLPACEWEKFIKLPNNKNDYVLIYILHREDLYKKICKEIDEAKIFNIKIFNKNDGKDKFQYSPLEFVSLVKNASSVVTNSFHGACFATIFNKQVTIYKYNASSDKRFDIFSNNKNVIFI